MRFFVRYIGAENWKKYSYLGNEYILLSTTQLSKGFRILGLSGPLSSPMGANLTPILQRPELPTFNYIPTSNLVLESQWGNYGWNIANLPTFASQYANTIYNIIEYYKNMPWVDWIVEFGQYPDVLERDFNLIIFNHQVMGLSDIDTSKSIIPLFYLGADPDYNEIIEI